MNQELWMNSPIGYPYAEKIEKNNEHEILRFMLMISGADEANQEVLREATHDQRIKMLEDSGFTFDPIWLGQRELPTRPDGAPASALDDQQYRMRNGIGNGLS